MFNRSESFNSFNSFNLFNLFKVFNVFNLFIRVQFGPKCTKVMHLSVKS